jgi:Predicted Co/Zn/Cd cation transporters
MLAGASHTRLLRLATFASLGVAITLVVAKAIAWWLSGSVSLLAGLTDSLLDGAASFLNLLAVHYAIRPADDDHRYGHGKAESPVGAWRRRCSSRSAPCWSAPRPSTACSIPSRWKPPAGALR